MKRTVALFGVPGVGKSYTVSHIASSMGFKAASASCLLMEGRRLKKLQAIYHDDLRKACIEENQQNILLGYSSLRQDYEGILLLDCHTVIDVEAGFEKVPAETFANLEVAMFISLQARPSVIKKRREAGSSRIRPERSEEQLKALQIASVRYGRELAEYFNVPIVEVDESAPAGWYKEALRKLFD